MYGDLLSHDKEFNSWHVQTGITIHVLYKEYYD